MAPGSQVGVRPAALGDLQMSIKIYGRGRSQKFPDLAPFPGWGSCNLEAGRRGMEWLCLYKLHPTHWFSSSV